VSDWNYNEQRWLKSMNEQLDALVRVELDRIKGRRFFPEKMTSRVVLAYHLKGKDDQADPRVKLCLHTHTHQRTLRIIRTAKKGLRLWIPVGGGQWQWAPATTAGAVRVFRNNYREMEQTAGAKREALDAVLAAHEAKGLNDEDAIRDAYEEALA
jgi:hypothetical protein